jgi:probable F420-dependent oxidoreductase
VRRPFRFGAGSIRVRSHQEWVRHARKVEDLGYSTLWIGQHPSWGGIDPMVALMAAADATTRLRVASHALTNDLHNPVVLAQAACTLDMFSGGRLEFGLGAGWLPSDYETSGVPFDPASVRIARLEEAVRVIKGLWGREPQPFRGAYYRVIPPEPTLEPTQRPHPPLFMGGGGRRMLMLAAREADIVGLQDRAGASAGTAPAEAIDQQIAWVREAAGARFAALEIGAGLLAVRVSDDRRRAAQEVAAWMASLPSPLTSNATADQVLGSVRFLVGSIDEMVADLEARRERFGMSYITVFGEDAEAFSPVVARLAGT